MTNARALGVCIIDKEDARDMLLALLHTLIT